MYKCKENEEWMNDREKKYCQSYKYKNSKRAFQRERLRQEHRKLVRKGESQRIDRHWGKERERGKKRGN